MRKTISTGLYLLLFSLLTLGAYAQSGTITGTVSTAEGNRISGVTVTVQNTTNSTATDNKGEFTIQASPGETLVFTSVGYENELVKVGTSNRLDVRMSLKVNDLDEVVVVGYGVQKKSDVTSAITDVNMDQLANRPSADVGRGLQGVVPGLSVRIPSGEVGSDPLIRIRGFIGSIAGSSQPLILVDNVEVPSIQLVNPNDIASISVLKDAAAASIYGAKGAFGVILITTKKGSNTEQNTLNYSGNYSWQTPFENIDVAGVEGVQYALDASKNMKVSGPGGGFWRVDDNSMEKILEWQEKYGDVVKPGDPIVYGRDWYWDGTDKFGIRIYDPVSMMIKKQTFTQTHNLSLNGSSGKTSYNIGLGYLDQDGMMKPAPHDDFKRYTGKLNMSTEATSFLTVRAGLMFSDWTKRYPNATSASGFGADPWLYMYRWSRLFPTGATELGSEVRDPYWETKNAQTNTLENRYTNLNLGFTVDINKNWDIIADYSYSVRTRNTSSSLAQMTLPEPWFTPVLWKDEDGNQVYVDDDGNIVNTGGMPGYRFPMSNYVTADRSYISRANFEEQKHTINAYSTYHWDLNTKNKFKFMLGTNIVADKWVSSSSRKTELTDKDNPQFNFADGSEFVSGDANWSSLLGYFGRINYSYDDKYLLEVNLRRDATSIFPAHMRWKWYPSFSAGWVLSQENFMESLKPVLSYAKIRGSWGSIGDQSVSNALYIARMSGGKGSWLSSDGQQLPFLGTPNPISPDITWQDIESLDIGADLRFMQNKLGITFDWFQRKTNNMIISGLQPPATAGTSAPDGNFGYLTTKGWELSGDFSQRFENGLGINISANISDFYTDISKSADWNIAYENRSIDNTYTTGKRYGDIYGYVTDRLYQADDFVYDDHGDFVKTVIVWNGSSYITHTLAGAAPIYQPVFEDGTGNVRVISPGDVKFVDIDGDGYITPGKGTFGDPGDRVVIGNSLPRYEYGARIALDYKGFDLSIMGQGVGKRAIWGVGSLAIPGYHAKDGGMPGAIARNYWTPERTDAFYPRAWNLDGANSGFTMVPQTRYLLNMAYFRIKNITLGYNIPTKILNSIHLKQARAYISLENPITWDHLRGLPIDPETISGSSMLSSNYNLGRTGTDNPTFKIYSVGVNISL